ncbi:hypothetical protein [Pseudomonas sp. TWP3-2]|uniref:hypothetical protein n=1 Tax=Pseudomonas sp. TWP3-2 TaxID=2804574 RepID=UPI003CF9E443
MNEWKGVVTNVEKVTQLNRYSGEPDALMSIKLFITLSDGTKIMAPTSRWEIMSRVAVLMALS